MPVRTSSCRRAERMFRAMPRLRCISEKRRTPWNASWRMRKVQRSPRISIARPAEHPCGSRSVAGSIARHRSGSAAEGRQLAREADGVVVGHEEARAGEHAQDGVREEVERLL